MINDFWQLVLHCTDKCTYEDKYNEKWLTPAIQSGTVHIYRAAHWAQSAQCIYVWQYKAVENAQMLMCKWKSNHRETTTQVSTIRTAMKRCVASMHPTGVESIW